MILLLILINSCELKDEEVQNDFNGFETQETADLFKSCASSGCHGGNELAHGLSVENYELLMKGSKNRPLDNGSYSGEVIIPFSTQKSLLYQIVTGNSEKLNPDHLKLIRKIFLS